MLVSMNPEKKFRKFEEFLVNFVRELNSLSEEGGVILVEGKRDIKALSGLGYRGKIVSIASLRRKESRGVLGKAKPAIILTDLDREGRKLAARYAKLLTHDGVEPTLEFRKRLLVASRGTFLHLENLSRFSHLNTEIALLNQVVPG